MNQGTKGNKTGNLLEGTVRNILIEKGFEIVGLGFEQKLGFSIVVVNGGVRHVFNQQLFS